MEELIQAVIEALNSSLVRPDGLFTTSELEDSLVERGTPINRRKLLKILGILKQREKIRVEKQIQILDVSDRQQSVRGWRWIKES